MKWSRVGLLMVVPSVLCLAGELSPSQRLRRLSMHLKGTPPPAAEFEALGGKTALELEAFFREKSRGYLSNPAHVGKMVTRVDELLRLRTLSALPEVNASDPSLPAAEALNMFDLSVIELVKGNESWDRLLRSPAVPVYLGPSVTAGGFTFQSGVDASFLANVFSDLSQKPVGVNFLSLEPSDMRFAGVLTSGRFFSRYSTTNLNKNRGRAAAVFRTFLCDDMRAVVEPSVQEEGELLKKAFPEGGGSADGYHRSLKFADDDRHGSQESCMACHYKLDPLGGAFITSGSTLSDLPAPGALVFRRADNSLVNIPGRGIGEIASTILAQPEYVRCQVTHFWKWFIRADKMPSEARLGELVAEFDRVGRRVNDFIDYLVNEPEFYTEDDLTQATLLHAKPLLQRCVSCHTGLGSQSIPSFVAFPIGGSQKTHEGWIEKIVGRLDLAHDGRGRTMPPKESAWQPSAEDIVILKSWISYRAMDEAGLPSVSQAQANDWLEIAGPITLTPRRTFRRTFRRYVSGQDIFRLLHEKFPSAPFPKAEDLQILSIRNRAVFGDPNPFDGLLVYENVGPGFVKEFGKSVSYFAAADIESGPASYLGAEVLKTLGGAPKEVRWSRIPRNSVRPIIQSLIRRFVDPGQLASPQRVEEALDRFQAKKLQDASVVEALKRMVFLLLMQEEFLAY
ncbi:MAG: DUF1588 domain-containing protein [Deltaproteobacteria bacterium]|nr:DUF1588 domain-containing protein [Deltaproteobacteria bacterium]